MTENNNIKTCDKYEEYFEGFNNIGKDLDELKKSFDDELICIQKSVKKDKKSYPIFQDDKAFDVFRKLCKLKLLDIVKDTFKLTKHDIKAINKVIEQDRLNINAQDVHHLYKLADKFTENDIQYLERAATAYENDSIEREFDSFAQERFTELNKCEKQVFDQFEKEQLSKTEKGKAGSIKSLFTRIFKIVIRKLQHGEKLVELKSTKEQQSSFISHLPEKSLNDLTDFNFAKEEHKLENSSTKMDARSNLIDLNTTFDQVTITEINNKQLSQ
ncbi:hypothetical protein [Candidatus Mesenet endosymbiont of Agriotes lineatus]|uniref:hypothetical protein n=1 Tax=Candidatus Mesenet endosymbiont of Agriotes lineatus TaxID=3077948 RepID=UPI0030D1E139